MARSADNINWTEKFKKAKENHPFFVGIAIIVFFVSSTITIIEGIGRATTYYSSTFGWRDEEEKVINSLSPGISIAKFEEVLGVHTFYRDSSGLKEYVFKRRGYWVQAVTDEQGSVTLYAITSCDESFKPTIKNSPAGIPIKLRETTFKAASGGYDTIFDYSFGNTTNSYIFEGLYLGNPGRYQTVYWGWNDVCGAELVGYSEMREYLQFYDYNPEDEVADRFRSNSTFNTFAVTSPFGDGSHPFQIGVDRVQVRTVDPP